MAAGQGAAGVIAGNVGVAHEGLAGTRARASMNGPEKVACPVHDPVSLASGLNLVEQALARLGQSLLA
jgi:hypothetical protein